MSEAAKIAGIGRRTERRRERDEKFADAWAAVVERVVETLEREAVKRAHDGSDVLLIFPVVDVVRFLCRCDPFDDTYYSVILTFARGPVSDIANVGLLAESPHAALLPRDTSGRMPLPGLGDLGAPGGLVRGSRGRDWRPANPATVEHPSPRALPAL